jgi:hypothetical protein
VPPYSRLPTGACTITGVESRPTVGTKIGSTYHSMSALTSYLCACWDLRGLSLRTDGATNQGTSLCKFLAPATPDSEGAPLAPRGHHIRSMKVASRMGQSRGLLTQKSSNQLGPVPFWLGVAAHCGREKGQHTAQSACRVLGGLSLFDKGTRIPMRGLE